MPHPSQMLIVRAVTVFVVWRMYARIRRVVGRQVSSAKRQWVTVCVFPALVCLKGVAAIGQPILLAALGGGMMVGAVLGIVGHRLTKFEQTAEKLYYTPKAHIGIAVTMLLVGRTLYSLMSDNILGKARGAALTTQSPITIAIFGVMAGYYVCYAIGLILWRRRAERGTA